MRLGELEAFYSRGMDEILSDPELPAARDALLSALESGGARASSRESSSCRPLI